GAAEGFVVGANFFRAQFPSFFFSAKGYYQFLFERHTYNGLPEEKIDLNLNHWGVAIDVGIPLFDLLDWKIFEGGIRFINAKLTNSITADSYESKNTELGYYFGSGVVIHAIKDYISIEGTVSYNVIKVDNIEDKNGNKISAKDNFNLIKSGSIISSLQLNIGFPL
ncbi:MAG: hypothetical protein JW866_02130, partial [Ignavibacteriales bacterium]|nr:hypothetical protein [Ignavibacteriales bacterium]